jgi:4-amino-4-deoxy-L-arabinose transferase-like glycosyltransferase
MKSPFAFLAKPANAFGLLTLFYICFMFLPRVVPQGMFVDGLLYSSISRNLAEGRGSWWLPYFSRQYWIEGIARDHYYENPPLLFWMQSMFFRALGDHWWVEKLYATLLLLLNCFLITRIWKTVLKSISGESSLQWLPVLFFYLVPIVFWGSPYNLIDSQLLTFCLLATWAILSGMINQRHRSLKYGLAVSFIFLGMLTKGPVAVYPVALPFIYYLVFAPNRWRAGVMYSMSLFASVMLLFALLLLLHPPALNFFEKYWNQRLSYAIMGGRSEGVRHGFGRLYVIWILFRENSILIALTSIGILFSFIKGIPGTSPTSEKKWALVFLGLGLAGTVPLMLSTRQAAMYLIPSLVMFAMAAALFLLSLIKQWMSSVSTRTAKIISITMIFGIIGVMIHSAFLFGKPAKDIALLEDIQVMQPLVPKTNSLVLADTALCGSAKHTYLQRYLKLELTTEAGEAKMALAGMPLIHEQDSILKSKGFVPAYSGKKLTLYLQQR